MLQQIKRRGFMFNVTWIPINSNVLTDNLGPGQCHVDIVGNPTFPALFIGFDDTYVYFRMRVNCDPRQNKNKPELQNSIWGILIKGTSGTPLYTVRVNAKNDPNSNAVQVYNADANDPFIEPVICSNTIVYGDAGNVQINPADSSLFDAQDYFVDFRTPLSCFPDNFFEGELIYCGFTSEDRNNINKEIPPPYSNDTPNLCGGEVKPPPVSITITKDVQPTNVTNCPTDIREFTVKITVKNNSNEKLTGITVTDTINGEFQITSGSYQHTWTNVDFDPNETKNFTYSVTGFFPNAGTFPFNTAVVTQNGTELGRVTGPDINVEAICNINVPFCCAINLPPAFMDDIDTNKIRITYKLSCLQTKIEPTCMEGTGLLYRIKIIGCIPFVVNVGINAGGGTTCVKPTGINELDPSLCCSCCACVPDNFICQTSLNMIAFIKAANITFNCDNVTLEVNPIVKETCSVKVSGKFIITVDNNCNPIGTCI